MKRAFFHRSIHRGDKERKKKKKKKKFHDAFNAMKHPLSIPLTLSRDRVTNSQIQWPALYPLIHFTMKFIVRGIKNWFRVEQRTRHICAGFVSR